MNKILNGSFLLAGLLFLAGPAWAGNIPEPKLRDLSLGMKQEDIIFVLGQPVRIKSEGSNAEGKSVERMEYNVIKRDSEGTAYTCSLTIVNGALARIEKRQEKTQEEEPGIGDYKFKTTM